MSDVYQSELFASIATLDQLKRLYDLGAINIRSFQQESQTLLQDVQQHMDEMKRMGIDVNGFLAEERIIDEFPEAARMIGITPLQTRNLQGLTEDEYYDYIGLAVLDVATANSNKGLMGLAELIIEVVRRLPELKSVSYNDVIEAVNRVSRAGLIPGIRTLKGGVKIVELRPLELRRDQADVINLAASKGYVTLEEVMMALKWSEDHARRVLSSLVEAGMAVVDMKFSTGGRYYFPGLRSSTETKE
ncbi:MAG: EAP30/Vps36 family vacuolar-sorting protein [Candidatus Thorarchaeota archaeon]|nr:EAP30/Vps36 family vacuolar-sorting protein [Candidatus Thorarchaeota archaeon]